MATKVFVLLWLCMICASASTARGSVRIGRKGLAQNNGRTSHPSNDSNISPILEERFSGNGAASGSTSGREDVEEEEDEICPELPQNEHNNSEDIISSTAYSEVSCHVACMEEVANSSDYPNARIQSGIFALVHAWRYLSFPEFKRSDRKNTCPAFRKFKLCYKGCLVRTQLTKANLTRNQCKRDCKSKCTEEKKANTYYNSYCAVKCYSAGCLLGCDKFAEIKKAQNTTGSPEGPVTGPQLVTTGPGLFQLKHTVSSPAQNTAHPVGLVYHIVDILTRVTVFMSQVDLGDVVDLQRFMCRRISVSYVAVNRFGASAESPPVLITIPGALNPPTIESVSRDVDTRLGFFGYGVVTVSWQHPKSSVYIEHYTVKMFSFSADKSKQTWKILNNVTILTIRAETTGNLFRLGTPYTFQVCSVSGDEEECDEKYYRLPPVPDTVLQITSCDSHWTGTHFHYTIQWNIPDYIAFVGGIIDSFNMGASLQYKGRTVSYYASGVVEKHTNQTTYSTTRTNYRPQTSDYSYHFTVSIHWVQGALYSLPNVISKDCIVKALPPPPSPVLNVSISGIAIAGGNLQFQFSWDPPTSTNGYVAEYMACLSNQVFDDENEEDFSFYGSKDDVTCVDLNKTSSSHSWDYRFPLSDCTFFQMRARTEYRVGDWSEEIAISTRPYDGISLECLVVDVSEDEMSSVEVSWTMQNETFCIHLEAAPIHSVEITLEATGENSSLIASLASVKLPLSKIEYTFSDIPTSNDSVFFIEFEATGNQMKPYNKVLMAECVRVLPSSLTPSNTTTDTTAETTSDATTYTIISVKALSVVLGVAIVIITLSILLLICVVCQRRKLCVQKALKPESPERSAVNSNLTAHSSTTLRMQSNRLSQSLPSLPIQTNSQSQVSAHQLLLGQRKQASESNIYTETKTIGRSLGKAEEEQSKSEGEI